MTVRHISLGSWVVAAALGLACDIDIDINDGGDGPSDDGADDEADDEADADAGDDAEGEGDAEGEADGPADEDDGAEESTDEGGSEVDDGGEESTEEGGSETGGGSPYQACDPLVQDCADGDACYLLTNFELDDGYYCAVDASGSEGSQFDACEFINVCDPGLSCTDSDTVGPVCAGSIGCCTFFCDLSEPDSCGAGECQAVLPSGEEPPGLENVGVCVNYP